MRLNKSKCKDINSARSFCQVMKQAGETVRKMGKLLHLKAVQSQHAKKKQEKKQE